MQNENSPIVFMPIITHPVRTSKALKLKYESLKKCTKKMTLHRQELYRTGGGPSAAPTFDDLEEKVLAICSNISGLDARNDSDNFSDTGNILPSTNDLPENGIPVCKDTKIYNYNLSIDGVTSQPADTLLLSVPETVTENQPLIEEVMDESDDYHENQNKRVTAESTDVGEVLKDCQNKWGTWNPKALKSKVSQALKPCKSSVTAKLDQLSTARLELVQLQKEIANREHLFVKEEHELKMMNLTKFVKMRSSESKNCMK